MTKTPARFSRYRTAAVGTVKALGARGSQATATAKEAIALAAEKLGGVDRLVAWAREDELNERAFWASIYPKLLPLQVTGEGGGPIRIAASALSDDDLASIAAGGLNG